MFYSSGRGESRPSAEPEAGTSSVHVTWLAATILCDPVGRAVACGPQRLVYRTGTHPHIPVLFISSGPAPAGFQPSWRCCAGHFPCCSLRQVVSSPLSSLRSDLGSVFLCCQVSERTPEETPAGWCLLDFEAAFTIDEAFNLVTFTHPFFLLLARRACCPDKT